MSKIQDIKNMIFEDFVDGEIHTFEELRNRAIEKEIISDANDSALSNAIFSLKSDKRFKTIEKGKYIIDCSDEGQIPLETIIDSMVKRLEEIKRMTALDMINQGITKIEKEIEMYKILKKELDDILR